MGLTNPSAAATGSGVTYVTAVISSCSTCILENCFCGTYISGYACSQVRINGGCAASPNACCSPPLQPLFLMKGTSICSAGAGGSIILTGYFFD